MMVISGPEYVLAVATVKMAIRLALLGFAGHTASWYLIKDRHECHGDLGFLQYFCGLNHHVNIAFGKILDATTQSILEYMMLGHWLTRARACASLDNGQRTYCHDYTHVSCYSSDRSTMLTILSMQAMIFQCSNPAMRWPLSSRAANSLSVLSSDRGIRTQL